MRHVTQVAGLELISHVPGSPVHPGFATMHGLRSAVFSARVPDAEVGRHCARMQPESQRAVFDLSWPQHFFVGRGPASAAP